MIEEEPLRILDQPDKSCLAPSASIVVVKPALQNDQSIVFTPVDQPVLLSDAAGPPTFEIASQRFRLANTVERIAQRVPDQLVHPDQSFAVIFLPPQVVHPAAGQPHQSHSSPA